MSSRPDLPVPQSLNGKGSKPDRDEIGIESNFYLYDIALSLRDLAQTLGTDGPIAELIEIEKKKLAIQEKQLEWDKNHNSLPSAPETSENEEIPLPYISPLTEL